MLRLLRRSVDEYGQTIVMVTHDGRAAAFADRVLFLRDGEIVEDHGHLEADAVYDVVKELEGA
jgi:putative ABC transport system ATP-binding protein